MNTNNSKKYEWLLFDLDNTLLDFSGASKESLFRTFEEYGLHCNEEIYKIYTKENANIWHQFEEKEIDTVTLRKIRFKSFFEIIDQTHIDPFLFNARYLENIVESSKIYDGVKDLLDELKQDYKLSIVTNGLKEVQRPRLKKTGIYNLFDSIVVSDEINIAKPDARFFEVAHKSLNHPYTKDKMLMIGDNIKSDIQGGQGYGLPTCWLSHGNSNQTDIMPCHSIYNVLEIHKVLS